MGARVRECRHKRTASARKGIFYLRCKTKQNRQTDRQTHSVQQNKQQTTPNKRTPNNELRKLGGLGPQDLPVAALAQLLSERV